jgi:hypothetical protein
MKYRFRTRPYRHQVKALKKVLRVVLKKGLPGVALFVPMRYGKSKIVIDAACVLHDALGISRVLWVTTVSGLSVVDAEVEKHMPERYRGKVEFRAVNFEGLYDRQKWEAYGEYGFEMVHSAWIEEYDPDMVVVDECHHIGRPTTEQSKHAYHWGRRARVRIAMTGSPFHRKPFFVFGAMKFLDAAMLGSNFGNFKKKVALFGGYENREVIRYRNLGWLVKTIRPVTHYQKYVPRMKPQRVVVKFELDEGRELYERMEQDSYINWDGTEVSADIVLTKHLRLAQIAGGWVKATDRPYRRVGRERQRMFADDLAELKENGIDKLVVGCRWRPELNDAAAVARKAGYKVLLLHGGTPSGHERTRRFRAFHEATVPVCFIAQLNAAREAVDLSCASVMTFYSLPEDYLTYSQFAARIEKYNDDRTLQYRHLVGVGTRDVVTWLALRTQHDVAHLLWHRPDFVEELSARAFQRRKAAAN